MRITVIILIVIKVIKNVSDLIAARYVCVCVCVFACIIFNCFFSYILVCYY